MGVTFGKSGFLWEWFSVGVVFCGSGFPATINPTPIITPRGGGSLKFGDNQSRLKAAPTSYRPLPQAAGPLYDGGSGLPAAIKTSLWEVIAAMRVLRSLSPPPPPQGKIAIKKAALQSSLERRRAARTMELPLQGPSPHQVFFSFHAVTQALSLSICCWSPCASSPKSFSSF